MSELEYLGRAWGGWGGWGGWGYVSCMNKSGLFCHTDHTDHTDPPSPTFFSDDNKLTLPFQGGQGGIVVGLGG
ncbi:hypothetical protein [Okeania sp. SIO3I5]|uniref:hypothetical protein n=1 Tax=Okeania sp. SIO3I5 TaxID=2607805 RepID=UPI0025E62B1E|nr:hypothetical protein [Okeania sp. SIO3I5]